MEKERAESRSIRSVTSLDERFWEAKDKSETSGLMTI